MHWHVYDDTRPDYHPQLVRTEPTYKRAVRRAVAYAHTLALGAPEVESSHPKLPYRQATVFVDRGAILVNQCDTTHRTAVGASGIVHEIREQGSRRWYLARTRDGRIGSVQVEMRAYAYPRVNNRDYHLPVRLAEGDYWETSKPYDCSFTGEPSYCDGSCIVGFEYTTDADMFARAEALIPDPRWG